MLAHSVRNLDNPDWPSRSRPSVRRDLRVVAAREGKFFALHLSLSQKKILADREPILSLVTKWPESFAGHSMA
jgi:hypothetical protein